MKKRLAGRITIAVLVLLLGGGLLFRFWPHQRLPAGTKADLILVEKSKRTLSLLKDGRVIASYQIALGRHPEGHKVVEFDGRTPEGRYIISNVVPKGVSGFYRALQVSYPNAADEARARQLHKKAGNYIMVHGIKNGFGWLGRLHRLVDWTDGCMAVTNEEMQDNWDATYKGIAIEIRA